MMHSFLYHLGSARRQHEVSELRIAGASYCYCSDQHGQFPCRSGFATPGVADLDFRQRRLRSLPQARRSVGSDLRAVFDFLRTPMPTRYDLDRFERERGLSPPRDACSAMQNPEWDAIVIHRSIGEAA